MKRFLSALITVFIAGVSFNALSQTPNPNPSDAVAASKNNGAAAKANPNAPSFANAKPEDITNENFPNLIESFDYPSADITEVVKAISKLTGKNFILDSQVRGKITIIAPSQITVAEAYKAFLSALAMNGMTVVPSGNFLKIRPARVAQRDSIDTYSGRYFPDTDQLITRIIKLKYISAEELNKQVRLLTSKDGEAFAYSPTNSLIVTDYGSNVERIMGIINQLDVPGFEERLEVVKIRHARAKDIADLVGKIINKGDEKKGRFSSSRFSRKQGDDQSKGAESFSLVVPDDRTNSIIVVGNEAGIGKIRKLVKKLDFKLRPEDSGGVYVYYVKHGTAENIAKILNGIATDSAKAADSGSSSKKGAAAPAAPTQAIFGGDVKITDDPDNNSLIISASKQDYAVVKNLLSRIDIPRDQVFVKAIIMEMSAEKGHSWGINYYRFAGDGDSDSGSASGRIGFRGSKDILSLVNPGEETGAIIGFGGGKEVNISIAGQNVTVPSLTGLVKFLKNNVGGNVLSTPQIMALDNVEAMIEVGEDIPVGVSSSVAASGQSTTSTERKKATIKLTLTPFISPDTDSVRLKIQQQVKQASKRRVEAQQLADTSIVLDERTVETEIVVNSGDTAVIGGLMKDQESEDEVKVPVLGDIPILGWLFKSRQVSKRKSNLMVFITPKIIRNSTDNDEILDQKLNERIDFIRRHLKGRDPHGATIDALPRKANASPEDAEVPATDTF